MAPSEPYIYRTRFQSFVPSPDRGGIKPINTTNAAPTELGSIWFADAINMSLLTEFSFGHDFRSSPKLGGNAAIELAVTGH